MFFILSKLLSFFTSPIIWIFLLLLIALLLKNPKKKKRFLIATLAVFYFFTNSFVADEVMRIWEVKHININNINSYDYGIVLGGVISGYDTKNKQVIFNRSVDRLLQGIELYKKGIIKKIVFTGGSGSVIERNKIEANYIKNFLINIGIPNNDIIIENESRNTYENALFTKNIIGAETNRTDLLITSGYHMRRSAACFKKQGFSFDVYSADRFSGNRKFVFDHLFIPNIGALEQWRVILHEWYGFIAYRFMGYI